MLRPSALALVLAAALPAVAADAKDLPPARRTSTPPTSRSW